MKNKLLIKMMKKCLLLTVGLGFTLILAGCSLPLLAGEIPVPGTPPVYQTVSAGLTLTAPFPSPIPTRNITPTGSPSTVPVVLRTDTITPSAPAPTNTRVPPPCNLAAPHRPTMDITVPDGARYKSGEPFSKTWRLVNAGSCPWTKEYAVVWFSGELFSAAREQLLSRPVLPGETIDITIDMIAPRHAGIHQSNWKLRDARGALFGIGPAGDAPFWVRIEVSETSTATFTPQPSATVTPTLSVASKGSVELRVGQAINLDTGIVGSGAGDDLSFQKFDTSTYLLTSVNGSVLSDFGPLMPNEQDCRKPNLVNAPIKEPALKGGEYLCIRTTQGLPGVIYIKQLSLKTDLVELDYMVWAIP